MSLYFSSVRTRATRIILRVDVRAVKTYIFPDSNRRRRRCTYNVTVAIVGINFTVAPHRT